MTEAYRFLLDTNTNNDWIEIHAILDTKQSIYYVLNESTDIKTLETALKELNKTFPLPDPRDWPQISEDPSQSQKNNEKNLIKQIINGKREKELTKESFEAKYYKPMKENLK